MKKALFLSADEFEDTELLVPYYRLQEAGVEVTIASMKKSPIEGMHDYKVPVNKTFDEIDPGEYNILVLPGGKAPAKVRKNEKALEITRHFFEHNKPVAAICHGPQILISAGLMKEKHATCYSTVVPELKEAGAIYEDTEVVIDNNLVTSRNPSDLPAFMREIMKKLRMQMVSQ